MTHGLKGLVLITLSFLYSCGVGLFQTAETVPKGKVSFSSGISFIYNENLRVRKQFVVSNFPVNLGLRVGLSSRVDLGISQFLLYGLLVEPKLCATPPEMRFKLSLSGGIGGAFDPYGISDDSDAWIIGVPLTLIGSYDFGRIAPYVATGYSFYWIFVTGYKKSSKQQYVERKGYGDGVARFTGGLRMKVGRAKRVNFFLFLEYSFLWAAVDDPGDLYSFINSHVVSFGAKLTTK